jgi:malonyl-CoA decarboxylase
VHEIRSWTDLKNRLDSDRRLYAFFHPRMPMEPLIFVEVALTDRLADNVQALLDENAPVFDAPRRHRDLLFDFQHAGRPARRVLRQFPAQARDRRRDYPKLTSFATLSPLTFRRWAESQPEACIHRLRQDQAAAAARDGDERCRALRLQPLAATHGLTRLAARYLLTARKGEHPYDPVARFHLGNGARIERLNYLADTSTRGDQQSYGLMVNYVYDPDTIEENVEAFSRSGEIAAATAIRRSARD